MKIAIIAIAVGQCFVLSLFGIPLIATLLALAGYLTAGAMHWLRYGHV
jgi:hypothetical protein